MPGPADNTVRKFKPAEHDSLQAHVGERFRADAIDDRRRMNVSEKLAEGRGFWRGAFVGASIGVAGGIVASGGIAGMWTDQVLKTVQNSLIISGTLGEHGTTADLVKNVHPDAPAADVAPPAGPAGSSSR